MISELPIDPEIESLQTVLDPGTMLGVFREVFGRSNGTLPAAVAVRVLRHHPGRGHAVVEYRLQADDGSELDVCIGKVFAKRRRADRLQRVLDATYRHLGARTPAPVPLTFLGEHALVLMRKLEGALLAPILAEGNAHAEQASRLAASSLAALHSVPIEEGKAGSLEEELASVRKNQDNYRQGDASLAAEGELLLADIEARAAALPQPSAPALIHGSFRPTEVLVGSEQASIFDLDGWALGDPALDLGYYMADIWWESGKNGEEAIRPWAERLLELYLEEAESPGLRERARLYEAFSHARVMLKKLRSLAKDISPEKRATNLGLAELLRDRARSRLALAG